MPLYPRDVSRQIPALTSLNVNPPSTTLATVDSVTVPAGTLVRDGDCYVIHWVIKQATTNSCTMTIDCPTGVSTLLADARAVANDRHAWLVLERVDATTVRKRLQYLYGGATLYSPAPTTTGIADATAAIVADMRFTNGTAASDMTLVSRDETYIPAGA